jgi:hypothetical protein
MFRSLAILSALVLGALLFLVNGFAAEPSAPVEAPAETLAKDTNGVLVIEQDGHILGLIFVSKTGQVLPESSGACEANKGCAELVEHLHDIGHLTALHLPSAKAECAPIT